MYVPVSDNGTNLEQATNAAGGLARVLDRFPGAPWLNWSWHET